MKSDLRILVSGAGIGGLACTLALHAQGHEPVIVEQASELREVGAGVQLSANATRVLFGLGLEERLMADAVEAQGKEIRLWNTGQTWPLFDLGAESRARHGFPYLMMHRADLHAALADAVRERLPGAIRLGFRTTRVEEAAGQVVIEAADGRRIEADALIGADGVHSPVREALHGADRARFSGFVAWRAVIPMARLPAHMRRSVGVNWVGPGAHVINYPLRRGTLFNFVGIVERAGWEVERWTEPGDRDECLRDFAGWHPDVRCIIDAAPSLYKWALMIREPLGEWGRGRTTLLGDAAHPTLPFLAQGAAMAIEDAAVLGNALGASDGNVEAALRAYEAARRERCARIVRGSAENARRFHDRTLENAEQAQAYVEREWAPELVRARYEWLFAYDATRYGI
ncbi:MAG: FAD-dependent monooxygenase [Lautropia sp.]